MHFLPMEYYLEVVKEKSISRAAKNLHITQQTLSTHIAALENELNCTLFRRRPRFELTYAGQVFRDYAVRFTDLYRSMHQEFQDIAQLEQGELSVGVASTRGRFLLAPVLSEFRKKHPQIRINLMEAPNADLIALLLNDQADLIIANLTEDYPLFSSKPLYDEEMVLLVPSALLSANELDRLQHGDLAPLANCPFLMYRQKDIVGRMGNAILKKHGILPRIAVTSENLELLLDLCYAGEGACFCSKNLMDKFYEGRDCSHLAQISLDTMFSLRVAWLNRPYVSRALLDFIDICQKMKTNNEEGMTCLN